MPVHPVVEAADAARRRLLAEERRSATRLVEAYGRAYERMGEQIAALEEHLQTVGELTRAKAANLPVLRALRAQIVDEIDRFAIFADQEITQAAYRSMAAGITDSKTLVQGYLISPAAKRAVDASFRILPTEAVQRMIGFLDENSPLHTGLVSDLGEAVARRFEGKNDRRDCDGSWAGNDSGRNSWRAGARVDLGIEHSADSAGL